MLKNLLTELLLSFCRNQLRKKALRFPALALKRLFEEYSHPQTTLTYEDYVERYDSIVILQSEILESIRQMQSFEQGLAILSMMLN